VAREATDKYIAACVAPGTLRGYKKEWVKWLTFARASQLRGLLDLRGGPSRLCGRDRLRFGFV
jgi:hypothetical protein